MNNFFNDFASILRHYVSLGKVRLDLNLLALGALACEELSWREGEFGRLQDSEADAPLSFDGVSLDAEWALQVKGNI